MSAPGQLDRTDMKKIGKSLGIAMGAAALAYVGTNVLPMLPAKYGFLSPLLGTLVTAMLKMLQDTSK